MLDKTIPYFNIVMRRMGRKPVPHISLPSGYSYIYYKNGLEKDWAEIVTSVGEFDSIQSALDYFNENYMLDPKEVERRTLFIQTDQKEKVATITSWWNYTGVQRTLALEWVAVKPEYQGLSLGKAIVFQGVRRMIEIEGDRDIYLHTQTWSYRAIGIYLLAGFEFMKKDTFGNYINEFDRALPYLETKMSRYLCERIT
ncbi:MAG: GNAT family N-acetyltransferase [Clostridiales bacterium]|nr:GNAT family N-acetyltransferase [Clostridiales bacterium]